MIKLFRIFFIVFFFSCRTSQEIRAYEFCQKQQLTAHWDHNLCVFISFEQDSIFNLRIIEGASYGNLPILDTINIVGNYKRMKTGYKLIDNKDPNVNFWVQRYIGQMNFKGAYYSPKHTKYIKIRSKTIM